MLEHQDGKAKITRRRFTLGVLLAAVVGALGSLLSLLKVLSPENRGGGYVATVALGTDWCTPRAAGREVF